jgi:D-3-phosphoglycerate dehydrogenase
MNTSRAPVNAKNVFWFDDGKSPNVADVLDEATEIAMHRLEFDAPPAGNWAVMRDAHVYCVTSTRDEVPDQYKVHEALLRNCPNLLVVSASGAGYDPVDVEACTAAGVLVVNQSGANAEAVAEHAAGMMLALTKKMFETDRFLRRERGIARETFKGWNVEGKTLGIVGLGNTGRRMARICGLGLRMKIIAYDPYLTGDEIQQRGATACDFPSLVTQSDYVSVHCPYSTETKDMFNDETIGLMKRSAFLINCARGGITNELALAKALDEEQLAGAALDVWDVEPPPMDHPLLQFDNFIATYHTAGVTYDSRENMATWNAEQVRIILRGEHPPRLINPQAWDAFATRFETLFGHPVGDTSPTTS